LKIGVPISTKKRSLTTIRVLTERQKEKRDQTLKEYKSFRVGRVCLREKERERERERETDYVCVLSLAQVRFLLCLSLTLFLSLLSPSSLSLSHFFSHTRKVWGYNWHKSSSIVS
jgi:hypothetical protein